MTVPLVHAAGSSTIKVGLVGCGGRGTGAAEQALTADSGVKLVAMADAFQDRLEDSLSDLKGSDDRLAGRRPQGSPVHRLRRLQARHRPGRPGPPDHASPLPAHPPGLCRRERASTRSSRSRWPSTGPASASIIQACKDAKAKNLSLVNGFCWRYDGPRRETMKQVFDGKIGDIVAIETTYNSHGVWEPRKTREQCASDMEYQMRNWYYYCWLSGDHIVEQAVHGIDTMGWVMGDKPPVRCWGVGGRQSRTDPKYGNIYDHFSVVYEYPNNVRGYHQCRHWVNTPNRVKDYILGSKGMADVFGNAHHRREQVALSRVPKKPDMYQIEHDEMFAAIRAGKPINNGEAAAQSTLLALMGRTAAYTGQVITPGHDPQLQGRPQPAPLRVRPAGHAPRSRARQPQVRMRLVA